MLELGRNCWRIESAERFTFIVDAADYFVAARRATLAARRSIFLIGWDFDSRIRLARKEDEGPERLGDFIVWLAERTPALEVRLLRWDTGALKTIFRGSTLATVLRWKAHPRITLKLDGAHPLGGSHHQKILVIDDCLAFCGGIDMTLDRWDRRAHADEDAARVRPDGTPYPPWHDATSAFDGPAARAMGDLARDRWKAATGEVLPAVEDRAECWPDGLRPTLKRVRLGIARTRPAMNDVEPIHEIEHLHIDLIARAKRTIYAESQYFASRRIARAIAQRLAEEHGPEIVIINPESAEGWLEPLAMDTARARLLEALRRIDGGKGRFAIYHPQTAHGAPIYVHAKVMTVDDHYLRVGSSNFNNRSMRLDSECDVIVAADSGVHDDGVHVRKTIASLRDDLLAEHLGVEPQTVSAHLEKSGSLIATIEALRGTGRTLVPYVAPELTDLEEWLADNEILDPEGPDAIFEPLGKRGLFRGWRLRGRHA